MRIRTFILIITYTLLFGLAKALVWKNNDNKRLKANNRALFEQAEYYETQAGLSAASVEQLTLTASEFKRHYDNLVVEAEALNLKVKRLESASRTVTVTEYHFETRWRDSIVFRDGRIDTIACLSWRDPYMTFEACDRDGVVTPHIAITDTLVQFVHRVPKRFWFIKYGTKAIRQEVTTKNPNTEIVYTEYIKIAK